MAGTRIIKLSGKRANESNAHVIVDEEDYENITSLGSWHLSSTGYAVRRGLLEGKRKTIRMHRMLINTPDELVTDHINRNRLDNRKVNLRAVTQKQNTNNRERGLGYWYHGQNKNWCVEIGKVNVGSFESEELANQIASMIFDGELPLTNIKVYTPYCKYGHNREEVGTYNGNSCKVCVLENQRNYYLRRKNANTRGW